MIAVRTESTGQSDLSQAVAVEPPLYLRYRVEVGVFSRYNRALSLSTSSSKRAKCQCWDARQGGSEAFGDSEVLGIYLVGSQVTMAKCVGPQAWRSSGGEGGCEFNSVRVRAVQLFLPRKALGNPSYIPNQKPWHMPVAPKVAYAQKLRSVILHELVLRISVGHCAIRALNNARRTVWLCSGCSR